MNYKPVLLLFSHLIYASCSVAQTTGSFGKTPVWADEFNYPGTPDSTKWGYDTGGHGWGNNELQNYTRSPENVRVEKGMLIIEARQEPSGNRDFSSARLISKGKGDFLYGKIVVRAKLPSGRGTWPAIWMLASQNTFGTRLWPDNGEIDIMEHVGHDQNGVHGNIHTKAFNHVLKTNKGNRITVEAASTRFHDYYLEWTPEKIVVGVDNQSYFTFEKLPDYTWEQWPFDKPFHLLLNIAVGGNWGGQKGVDASIFPQQMEVDFIRVYPWIPSR